MSKSKISQRGSARVNVPERHQVEFRTLSLDQWLPADHRVRSVAAYVDLLDLSKLYSEIASVQGRAGRPGTDPPMLFTLWLFATIEGISSGRKLAALCQRDIPYMWICGGVSVNYTTLNDFRNSCKDQLEQVLVDSIGALQHNGLIDLQEITQDGMVVRANAGSSSFRTATTLESSLQEAQEHLDKLKTQQDGQQQLDRRQAAQKRAKEDRLARVAKAKQQVAQVASQREASKSKAKSEPRASTTDPEARTMKMGDGGFRPAYNVQFANDAKTKLIVGVDLTNQGTDSGLMQPMHQQLLDNYQVAASSYYVDGRFVKNDDITEMARHGTKVYGPLLNEQKQLAQGKDPYAAKRGDSQAVKEFRQRMGTAEAKEKYKVRCLAEFPNADCRNRNLKQFSVRSTVKAKAQVLWHVIGFNLLRMLNLGCVEQSVS